MPNLFYFARGRFMLALGKPYLISRRYLSPPARPVLPPAPASSSLLAQFNFQPWYFFLARDNLRWKQFHRLVTHWVIIISIRAPAARAEGTEERVDPARRRAALVYRRCGRPSSLLQPVTRSFSGSPAPLGLVSMRSGWASMVLGSRSRCL